MPGRVPCLTPSSTIAAQVKVSDTVDRIGISRETFAVANRAPQTNVASAKRIETYYNEVSTEYSIDPLVQDLPLEMLTYGPG